MSTQAPSGDKAKMLSERVFGLIFATIFAVIGLFPVMFGGAWREWALIVAGVFAVAALLLPILLRPLNIAWMHFGQIMHKIVNPILMGLIFFVAVLPTGIVVKLFGKDPMRRRFDKEQASYWIPRDSESQAKEHFNNQF